MGAYFTPETLRFLRGLIKNNDRAWFEDRRPVYERALKSPLHALIGDVNSLLADIAPEHVRPPNKIARRIYRDIRFSPDKRPYKRHLEAWWAREGLQKTSAAGLFLQIGPEGGLVAAGIYDPERNDLLLIRRWLAENADRYRDMLQPLLNSKGKNAPLQPLDPNALTRNPKGFAPDHPAGDLLRARNWGVTAALTPEQILSPELPATLAAHFRRMLPLVHLLNEPFLEQKPRGSSAMTWDF